MVCLIAPDSFYAVGQFYEHFDQTSDEEVIDLLEKESLDLLSSSLGLLNCLFWRISNQFFQAKRTTREVSSIDTLKNQREAILPTSSRVPGSSKRCVAQEQFLILCAR